MIDEDKLIKDLIETLESELPTRYLSSLEEFKEFVAKDLMRASYAVLDELRRKTDWAPSEKLQNLIRDYQVVF